jgi:hypothetical protein
MNAYQRRKARLIAAVLILAAAQSETPMTQLAQLAARMDERQWISVSLAARVPVADLPARALTVAYLLRLA